MMRALDPLEELVIEAVDPMPMKTMAALLRDPNPIHWDTGVTARLGLGDRPVNQGPLNLSYLAELAARTAGGPDRVRHLSVRFLANVFAGDRVVCSGTVESVDEERATIELSMVAEVDGRPVATAQATIDRRER